MGEVVIANRSCCRIISTNEVQMVERGSSGKITPKNNFQIAGWQKNELSIHLKKKRDKVFKSEVLRNYSVE